MTERSHPSPSGRVRPELREAAGPIRIRGGRIVTPNAVIEDGSVLLRDGRIAAVGPSAGAGVGATPVVDAADRVVMPGLVDLHGDDIERHLFPRSGARVDIDLALAAADRANVAAGVTTKFHAIAFERAPGENRSLALARELATKIGAAERLIGDNRVHARCELGCESPDAVADLIADRSIDLVSLMNHVPGDGQFDDAEAFRRRYADRGASADAAERTFRRRADVPVELIRARAEAVVEHANARGIPVASHDDRTADDVERAAAMGVTISEYPLRMDAARRAAGLGLTIAMGAPNLVRGGSLWGNLSADAAIEAGLVDVLCADYHPPSLLTAAFVDTGEPLSDRVARVTKAPADIAGLRRRGRIERGARADLLVVDPEPVATVERAFVGGREVFRTPMTAPGNGAAASSPGL